MKPVEGSEAQAVLDAAAKGDPIPAGYAFDGTTVYQTDAADAARIAAGGPVVPPPDAGAINPGETAAPATQKTAKP
jgi:hypothetical protein